MKQTNAVSAGVVPATLATLDARSALDRALECASEAGTYLAGVEALLLVANQGATPFPSTRSAQLAGMAVCNVADLQTQIDAAHVEGKRGGAGATVLHVDRAHSYAKALQGLIEAVRGTVQANDGERHEAPSQALALLSPAERAVAALHAYLDTALGQLIEWREASAAGDAAARPQ